MPLLRKIIAIGSFSKGITLPKDWIENAEKRAGKKMVFVELTVNTSITIKPYYEDEMEVKKN